VQSASDASSDSIADELAMNITELQGDACAADFTRK
jgi:hypothetical protein